MAKHMRTILSTGPGKGDNRRPEDVKAISANYDLIKKPCGCTFGHKCTCKKPS